MSPPSVRRAYAMPSRVSSGEAPIGRCRLRVSQSPPRPSPPSAFSRRQERELSRRSIGSDYPCLTEDALAVRRHGNYHGAVIVGPPGPSWQDSGIIDLCTKFEESHSAAIAQAANTYRVPMADVYSA